MEELDKECKVNDDYSSTKQSNGKVTWMIDKGIWLGKKAVITGAVISSAPLVLPPLVVLSTLGLVCSVPFGFVFATYACTQKIMSKLLPTTESSMVAEYNNKDDMEVVDLVQGSGVEEEGSDLEDVELVQGAVVQEYDDLLQREEERGYVEEDDDLAQRAEEEGYEKDEEQGVDLEQSPEEQDVRDTPVKDYEGDILQEKPIEVMEFGVTSGELDGRNDILPKAAALSQEDVLYSQDGILIYNEEPLEQEKLMLDVLKGSGIKSVLDEAMTSMDIHKQKPVVEEKLLKDAGERAVTMIELNVNDITEPESDHSYQAHIYVEKNDLAGFKEESDEMKREMLMRNDMDGKARNETQEENILQENDNYGCESVEERPIKIKELSSHEGVYKEDTTKYFQGTEVRNEKLIVEDVNEKPVIEMRRVIVSVHGGKKIAGEQENKDIKEYNKSQKVILVAKKITQETDHDTKSVVEHTTLCDMNSAREIADECGLDLFDYAAGDHESYNDFNISQETDNIRSSKTDDVAHLPVLRVSTKVAESKHMNLQPEAHSNEELLNEETLWEQIDALRAIVGYSAPKHTTSVEEIKALYIFTGVEPPTSFADNADLVEMEEKLRLLKSVVGVK